MKVSAPQTTKIDSALHNALEKAEGHEPLRTVMILESSRKSKRPVPDSTDFPDRTTYRKALIENQQAELVDELTNVKQELNDRSLRVKGGHISRAVVVEGTARDILSSLELPEVKHASLDQPLELKLH